MITGEVPFYDQSVALMLRKHLVEEPTAPSRLVGPRACPRALDRIILRCLMKLQDERFASASALREALAAVEFDGAGSASGAK
jgi:serine/threonine-protein kinase